MKNKLVCNIVEGERVPAFCKVYLFEQSVFEDTKNHKSFYSTISENSLMDVAERIAESIIEYEADYHIISDLSLMSDNAKSDIGEEGITGKYDGESEDKIGYSGLVRRLNDEEMADFGRMLVGKIEHKKYYKNHICE